jgi:Flp pilus assembly protein TadB
MTALLQQPIFLLLAGAFGLGVFLLAAGPVLDRRGADLASRLRHLDPDVWVDETEPRPGAVLGPLGEDLARTVGRIVGTLGLIAPHDLPRLLAQAGLGLNVRDFYQDKLLTALGLEAILVIANFAFDRLGLLHVGVWPLWIWLGVGAGGFVWPDLVVRQGASSRQQQIRAELPRLVDMLVVASSTGRGVQDAIVDVAPVLTGPLATEWQHLRAQLSLGLAVPLRELAARNRVRELDVLVGHLIAAYERGQGLEANLVQLSETLREQRLQELTAEGGRATGTMFLPVIFLVYLPLLVLVMAPVAATLADLLSA